jgi:hypothetical protein
LLLVGEVLEARYRGALLGAAALTVFAVAWLIAAAGFHQPAGSAVPIAAALDAIALMLIAPYIPGPVKPPELAGEVLAEARERLRQTVRSQVAQQAVALTDRGVLAVPWTGGLSYACATVPDLASIVVGGQLIVFGDTQSGKTTLATRLAEELSTKSTRQPVLFSLATWSPATVWLKDWMLQTIRSAYGLASPADLKAAEATLRDGGIVPIFDGLDEIGASDLIRAADAIHKQVGASPAVLTSIRTPETDRAARAALPSATVITMAPVEMQEVSRYLLESPFAEIQELDPITSEIINDPRSPVGQALSSPLMAWLAKTIYAGGGPATSLRGVARPDELANRKIFGDFESVEKHLLRGLPISVFERYRSSPKTHGSAAGAFTPEQAERWLGFLAARATRRIIAFWEFHRYAPLFRIALMSAVIAGCAIAAVGDAVGYFAGPGYLLLLAGGVWGIGWSHGYATRDKVSDPTRLGYRPGQHERLSLHEVRFARAVAAAIVAYASGVVLQTTLRRTSWLFGLTPREFGTAAFVATVLCFLVANIGGRIAAWILLRRPEIDARMGARAGDPLAAIQSDKRSGVVIFVIAATVLGVGIALYDVAFLSVAACWNVCVAPLGAVIAASIWNEWLPFKVSHLWLTTRGRLPRHLGAFLRQCHEGGILRKNGNHFEFRHMRLQESLRTMAPGGPGTR